MPGVERLPMAVRKVLSWLLFGVVLHGLFAYTDGRPFEPLRALAIAAIFAVVEGASALWTRWRRGRTSA